ncbi:helix-turn-helix domain-containing protein [Streptomyces syringium]|uniref:helix-turn-helix domain-containing protein n=1 Tax=Streptomyces syringium TaxID=76729 RepID=UPI0033CCCB0E
MERPRLTQREAAAACGVSPTTIRRYREAGRLPGAQRQPGGGWLIPVEDLLAAGLRLHVPSPPEGDGPGDGTGHGTPGGTGGDPGSAELLAQLAAERHRREMAEAEARHLRDRLDDAGEHLADLRRALLALTPGTAPVPGVIPGPSPVTGHVTPDGTGSGAAGEPRRWRWWAPWRSGAGGAAAER